MGSDLDAVVGVEAVNLHAKHRSLPSGEPQHKSTAMMVFAGKKIPACTWLESATKNFQVAVEGSMRGVSVPCFRTS